MKKYELTPTGSRKNFYSKAIVTILDNGDEILTSYQTDVIKKTKEGKLIRLWDGWSVTTGRHIMSFCGLNKKEYLALNMEGK